ncbi:MAG: hypothetical protein AAFY67_21725, partial [Cyanobacteria bacterium J06642_9]
LAAHTYTAAAARSLRLFAYQDVIQLVAEGLHHCQYLPSRDRHPGKHPCVQELGGTEEAIATG